ncbi:hypothetical protein HRW12_00205 [Streptomyces lunaelactis]|uniref:SGNH/GDSL hydrolase family protein n=1 Tax=Streptomyces lunaelactis TaxID=1535768 RepID=UPI001585C52A|nr:GDSL-type esterase/lipase family protein [Streptomyces lunaelactis]NUK32219.1 hypothetical protein [Streptomyces lunaelactis]NUK44692.1 hypothetical protein [Streptomyces lunaelactis]
MTTSPMRPALAIGWFGTSIMEHVEACSSRLDFPTDLPSIGTTVVVEEHRQGGYARRVHLGLQAAHPHVTVVSHNRAVGGATSRDICALARRAADEGAVYDVAFLGCGINDVWRSFQAREAEAVGVKEYAQYYAEILTTLVALSRVGVVCLSETPFGPVADPAVVKVMNERLASFNEAAARAAATAGAHFVDVWTPFTVAADELGSGPGSSGLSLWSDGVHLSDLGDALMQQRIEAFLTASSLISPITM